MEEKIVLIILVMFLLGIILGFIGAGSRFCHCTFNYTVSRTDSYGFRHLPRRNGFHKFIGGFQPLP